MFAGCSPISLSTYIYASGEVSCKIDINLTSLKTTGNELSYGTKVEIVYQIMERYSAQLASAYQNRLIELFSNKYDFDGMTDLEKIEYILGKNPSLDVKYSQNNLENEQSTTMFSYSAINELHKESIFASTKAYIMFFFPNAYIWDEETKSIRLDGDIYSSLIDVPITNSSIEEKEDLFFKTYIQTATPFTYNGEEAKLLKDTIIRGVLYAKGTTIASVACTSLGLDENDADYVFKFSTPYKRVSSNGQVANENGYYVHTWNFGNDSGGVVTLTRRIANYTSWYAFGAILGLAVVSVGLLAVQITNKTRKNKAKKQVMSITEFMSVDDNDKDIKGD